MSPPATLEEYPVVILAGGLGTRLRPVIPDRPKGLAPVGDRPFLEIQIALLREQGARRFVLCVGHRADQIRDRLGGGSRLGVRIEYSVEPETLLGTGGALRLAERFFLPYALVLNGDTYLAADYRDLVAHHAKERAGAGAVATMALARLEDGRRFGTVALDPDERFLAGFREKVQGAPAGCWLNAGAYVIELALLRRIPPGTTCSLERDVLPAAIDEGLLIAAYRCTQPFFDIGTGEDYHHFGEIYRRWCEDAPETPARRMAV
jgi:NDP-sugar pyrophosphorylase family protein